MAAPVWQPGTLYLPGDLVQPITQPPPNNPQVVNGDFSAGNTGWTFSGDGVYSPSGGYGGGGPSMILAGDKPDGLGINNTMLVVPVGGQLVATSMINQGASSAGKTAGWTEIRWYDSLNQLLQTDKGNVVDSGSGGAWHQSKVTGTRPASAAYAKAAIHLTSVADHNKPIWGDNLAVSGASAGLPEGLVYKAVQAESGTSGSSEPAWPGILGQQVVDNEVIWEAVTTSRVTWTASPRYVSGATEPVWPTDIGAMVKDGTINWRAISRRVEDEKCPQSKVVAIVASKVFAADKDIVRFSATANPLDWSTADDAGYLPTGLQQANSNDMAVLQQYRSNLVALNASSFQNWQVDPDPASMAILDQMDGIGSIWPKAAVGVSNDLFYLSQLGVRTVGIANAAENLAAGDVGAPIDPIIQEALSVAVVNQSKVVATYYPGAGQYWLAFSDFPPPALSIIGDLPDGRVGQSVTFAYLAFGGVAPRTFSLASGALPTGLALQADGRITGTRTTPGSASWVVRATDANGDYVEKPDSSVTAEPEAPTLLDASGLALASSASSIAVPMMATVATGDLLLMRVVHVNNVTQPSTLTAPSGWMEFAQLSNVTSGGRYINEKWWYKIATGAEGGTTSTVTAQHSGGLTGQVVRMQAGTFDRDMAPQAQLAYANAVNVSAPVKASPWGYAAVGMIAAIGVEYSTINILPPIAWPLANLRTTTINGSATGTVLTGGALCTATATGTSFAPGNWTLNDSRPTVAATIVVKGA